MSYSSVDLKVDVYEENRTVDVAMERDIEDLFNKNYFRYHFKSKLYDHRNIRFFVYEDNQLIGFGAIQPCGRFGILSNLLVDASRRGRGVGALIEHTRMNEVQKRGLDPYSSCVTLGTSSQILKLQNSMRPINYKIGNRIGVFTEDNVSSAVVFFGGNRSIKCVTCNRRDYDVANDRTRLVCFDQIYFDQQLPSLIERDQSYVDVLASPNVSLPPDFVFQGYDIDFRTQSAGRMFQYNNAIRRLGISGSMDLAVELSSVEGSILLHSTSMANELSYQLNGRFR